MLVFREESALCAIISPEYCHHFGTLVKMNTAFSFKRLALQLIEIMAKLMTQGKVLYIAFTYFYFNMNRNNNHSVDEGFLTLFGIKERFFFTRRKN